MSDALLEFSQKPRAMHVRRIPCDHRNGDQVLWCVAGAWVITSTSNLDGTAPWETYVFPANASGEITDRLELPGSFRGSADHAKAIYGYLDSLDSD